MMKKKNGQRGAFLVLAAVIIPFIFICAGFAADFGKAWAVRAKLQNAADAAVLAGAYQYSSNDQGNVEKLIRTYLSQNSGGLTYSYDKNRDHRGRRPEKDSSLPAYRRTAPGSRDGISVQLRPLLHA